MVLVSGGARYNMPGSVPIGRYDIEATFPGGSAVVVGSINVQGGSYRIACHPRFENCRVQ